MRNTPAAEKKPKTNAQYQAEYRQRVREGAGRRISTVVSLETYDALNELATQQKTSCRAILEDLILNAACASAKKALDAHEKAEYLSPSDLHEAQQAQQAQREQDHAESQRRVADALRRETRRMPGT